MKDPQPVMVLWEDSAQLDGIWADRETARKAKPLQCVSVGVLIKKTRKRLVLAMSANANQFGPTKAIPRKAVTAMWRLKRTEEDA